MIWFYTLFLYQHHKGDNNDIYICANLINLPFGIPKYPAKVIGYSIPIHQNRAPITEINVHIGKKNNEST